MKFAFFVAVVVMRVGAVRYWFCIGKHGMSAIYDKFMSFPQTHKTI